MRKTYASTELDVSFDPDVCIHAAECVRGLPAVFDTHRRPWIAPDAASADGVVARPGSIGPGTGRPHRAEPPLRTRCGFQREARAQSCERC